MLTTLPNSRDEDKVLVHWVEFWEVVRGFSDPGVRMATRIEKPGIWLP